MSFFFTTLWGAAFITLKLLGLLPLSWGVVLIPMYLLALLVIVVVGGTIAVAKAARKAVDEFDAPRMATMAARRANYSRN